MYLVRGRWGVEGVVPDTGRGRRAVVRWGLSGGSDRGGRPGRLVLDRASLLLVRHGPPPRLAGPPVGGRSAGEGGAVHNGRSHDRCRAAIETAPGVRRNASDGDG